MTPADIPRSDQPAPGAEPRAVQFRTNLPAGRRRGSRGRGFLGRGFLGRGFLGRRGFLGVLGAGAMTLGMTMLGWIPLVRRAQAQEGTEFPDCGRYSNGPGGPVCLGARYSPTYCGDDDWFITGCYERRGFGVCFTPIEICRADADSPARNAWRWVDGNIVYRCADGHAYWEGAPNPELVICSADLTPDPPTTSTPAPSDPPSLPSPTPSPPPTSPTGVPDLSTLLPR